MRSHVDMILFCTYLHVHPNELTNDLIEQIKRASPQNLYDIWLKHQRENNNLGQLSFHESYHYFQGLTLPYLFWYSFLCIRGIFEVFRALSRYDIDFHNWQASAVGFNNLSTPYQIRGDTGKFFIVRNPNESGGCKVELTLLDLIEGATSLAQYQVLVGYSDRNAPISFNRWTKRNNAYLKAFKFLVTIFEDEQLVLRFLIPLINTSFKTTQPIRTFTELINNIYHFKREQAAFFKNFTAQKEPCKWKDLFEYLLNTQIEFEAAPDSTVDSIEPPYCILNIENWINSSFGNIAETSINHPFISYHSSQWIEKSKFNPIYTWFIDYPGYVDDIFIRELTSEFSPSITFLKIHIDGVNDRMIPYGSMSYSHSYNFPLPLPDLMTIYGAVKRATKVQYIEEHRLCYHSECPEFRFNYCNSYPIIPKHYKDCSFTTRITQLINTLK